jgi:hypothetical protein
MKSQIEHPPAELTQRIYARVAGIVFLWLIMNVVVGGFIFPSISASGTFAETAQKIRASEHLFRLEPTSLVIESLSAAALAFALYVVLKPVNSLLALLAMIFWLQDIFLGNLVQICTFVRLHLYTSPQPAGAGTVSAQALVDLMRSIAGATENIGGISFGIALLLFFYLFFKSRYIPRILSGFSVCASAIWIVVYFARLIFPEQRAVFWLICFPLMAVALVITGVWLTLFTVKAKGGCDPLLVASARTLNAETLKN